MIKVQLRDLMKRSLILLIVFFAFLGCSKDDKGNSKKIEDKLIGLWVEKTEDTIEVLNLELKGGNVGFYWTTDDGEIDEQGKRKIKWDATENKFISIFNDEKNVFDYELVQDTLYLGEIIYVRKS